jgi:hypothetical protein
MLYRNEGGVGKLGQVFLTATGNVWRVGYGLKKNFLVATIHLLFF